MSDVPPEPIPERRRYYNPMLDPHVVENKMTDKMAKAVNRYAGGPLNEPDEGHPANLVSSLCTDKLHRPALDIDVPCELIPSSTPGHHHLYFPTVEMHWWEYAALLGALARGGILEPQYYTASLGRRQTLLRPPGVTRALPRP
jgi:hypothetical protein